MNGVVKEMLLPSPKGWIQAQDLVPGDELFGSDGKVVKVTDVQTIDPVPTYLLQLEDARDARCSEGQDWHVRHAAEQAPRIFDGETMDGYGMKDEAGKPQWYYPELSSPVEYPKKELDMDPYTAGTQMSAGVWKDPETGKSEEHIPERYLHGSPAQRLRLLQGIMDHGGTIYAKNDYPVSYKIRSREFAHDLQELIRSLGMSCYLIPTAGDDETYCCKVRFNISKKEKMLLFTDEEKLELALQAPLGTKKDYEIAVNKLRFLTKPMELVSIKVDAKDGAYLGNDFVVLHQ